MRAVMLKGGSGGQLAASVSEVEIPRAGKGELVVEMKACGLCGTDLEKLRGHYTASLPVLGHEAVGVVSEVGPGVEGFREGEAVFPHHHVSCGECHYCRHGSETMCEHYRASYLDPGGFSEYFRVPRWNVQKGGVLPLPAGTDFVAASLIEPVACCMRGINRCATMPGDSVLVVGAGPVGMIHALLMKDAGADVLVSDVSQARLAFAKASNVGRVVDARAEEVAGAAKAGTEGRGVDLAMVATGDPKAIASALKSVRKGGKVCLFGVPAVGSTLDYDLSALFNGEVSLLTTYGATEAETRQALDVICARPATFRRLVTDELPIERFDEAVAAAAGGTAMKVVVTP